MNNPAHPHPYKDRLVTKRAEEILAGDRLYRSNQRHPVILAAASNDLYARIAWEENGIKKIKTMLAWDEVEIVLPN